MTRADFEAELVRDGYEIREGEIDPDVHREAHAHGFDARVLVLDGSITLVFGQDRVTYGAGDSRAQAWHAGILDGEGLDGRIGVCELRVEVSRDGEQLRDQQDQSAGHGQRPDTRDEALRTAGRHVVALMGGAEPG